MVKRPHPGWWISIGIGMTLTTLLAVSGVFYAAFPSWFRSILPQGAIQLIAVAAWAAHVGEALYAYRLAKRIGPAEPASGWFLQTLALGFPSLGLLKERAASRR